MQFAIYAHEDIVTPFSVDFINKKASKIEEVVHIHTDGIS
jgi:hypothetical protein